MHKCALIVALMSAFAASSLRCVPAQSTVAGRRPCSAIGPVATFGGKDYEVVCAAFVPGDVSVVAGGRRGLLGLWNAKTGELIKRFVGKGSDVHAVSVLPDGKRFVSGDDDGSVVMWDISAGKQLASVPCGDRISALAVSRDGALLAVPYLYVGPQVEDDPAGIKVLRITQDGFDEFKLFRVDGDTSIRGIALSADGSLVAGLAANWEPGKGHDRVYIWDLRSGHRLHVFGEEFRAMNYEIAFSPDGKRLLSAGEDGLLLWDVTTGKRLNYKANNPWGTTCADYSPSGEWIISGGGARSSVLRRADDLYEIRSYGGAFSILPGATVYSARFSCDGTRIVTADFRGVASIWCLSAN